MSRGYFGIGVESISKTMNVGNLFRSAHAFGASFVFTVAANYKRAEGAKSDTSDAMEHLPFYSFPDAPSLLLPQGCKLVGIELMDDSIELPSFRHPGQAAYILGPERGELSPELTERCDWVVQIPTKFCVNVGIAGAIVMYDRIMSTGRFPRRADRPGPPIEEIPEHLHGGRFSRTAKVMEPYLDTPPDAYND
ncbi:MAG: RNA methyltransferase [Rhodospirillaceae bacterium]|jgi:tRNA G18 (ribose-2'-O)-methylase SpoU|nr:RNA methyltransferase [Rhodospirillaceae bacterium]